MVDFAFLRYTRSSDNKMRPTKASVDSKYGERLSLTSSIDINFLHEYSFPITLNPLFKYNLALLLGKSNLPEGTKYQIITRRDYFSNAFKFPPNHETPPRRCALQVLTRTTFCNICQAWMGFSVFTACSPRPNLPM